MTPRAIPAATYAARRARVRAQLGDSGVLVIAAAPELRTGDDGELRYSPDPDFYWLTGYTEPEAVLVLSAQTGFTLFVRPRDAERELWTGARGGVEAATAHFGADQAHAIASLAHELPGLLAGADEIFARVRLRPDIDAIVLDALAAGRRSRARKGTGPEALRDAGSVIDELRLIKDDDEIAHIRHAAAITIAAFREAAAVIQHDVGEWEVEAALLAGFRRRRAAGEAFPSIVAAGANATVLHYVANNNTARAGDMLLIDAGARYDMYCADVTRTYAVGAVSPERADAHACVLAAHAAAIAASRGTAAQRAPAATGGTTGGTTGRKPRTASGAATGNTLGAVHDAAVRVLAQGMIDLGLIDGSVDAAVESGAYKRYFPHGTGHWLGLDVHDVGSRMQDGQPRRLLPGMVFTVEPGLYIPANDENAPAGLRGVGIRIEDDVLITEDGAEVLTDALPTSLDAGSAS